VSEWHNPKNTTPMDEEEVLVLAGHYEGYEGSLAVATYDSKRDSYSLSNGSYRPTELFPTIKGSNAAVALAWQEIVSWDGEFKDNLESSQED